MRCREERGIKKANAREALRGEAEENNSIINSFKFSR